MRHFSTLPAYYQSETWNTMELGRSMGFSDKTVRSYQAIQTGTFMICAATERTLYPTTWDQSPS
jgi:hypothetical protein